MSIRLNSSSVTKNEHYANFVSKSNSIIHTQYFYSHSVSSSLDVIIRPYVPRKWYAKRKNIVYFSLENRDNPVFYHNCVNELC